MEALPQAGRGRPALDRAALGAACGRSRAGGDRSGPGVRDRRASDDPALRRAAPRARTRQRARHRLRLRRAGDCRRASSASGRSSRSTPTRPAVEAALRNAAANGVELEVRLLDATAERLPTAEIALANLDLPTLAATVDALWIAHARHVRLLRERPSGLRRLRPRGSQNRGRLGRRSVPAAVASACRWQRSRSASSAARCRTRMRMQSARHSFAMAMPKRTRPRSRSSTRAV